MSDAPRNGLRSAKWFAGHDVSGFLHRGALRAEGFSSGTLREGRPIVGICNSWSEVVNCNLHFRGLADAVRRGVLHAGGIPLEFPTVSLGENLMKPTAMLFRNLMAMDVEECIRAYPFDSVVLIAGCDKTIPGQLMGAASADVPAIMITGGPAEPAVFRGRLLSMGTDLWRMTDDLRAGRITRDEYEAFEAAFMPSTGHCNEMGTASTMSSLVEGLGMALPGAAAIPAVDARRAAMAEATGRRAVEMAREGLRPSQVLTTDAFDNAIVLLHALAGSTNAVVHLLALAGRVGVNLTLERFDELARGVPVVTNLRPAGEHLVDTLFHAGGIPAVLAEVAPLLHLDARTVSGRSMGENIAGVASLDRSVIGTLAEPFKEQGGIAVLWGSLAPDGAILKSGAASPSLFRHRGRAVVFEHVYDLAKRIDDPDLAVDPESVLVLKNAGPKGGPGMPEWGQLPIPRKLLRRGITDMVRVSDARMSGTSYGTVVLHVSPESASGGPLLAVENGDWISLDVEHRRIDLELPPGEIRSRLEGRGLPQPKYRRGYGKLYLDHVTQAHEGCDFDFLRKLPGEPPETEPLGILHGWIGGW